MLFPILTLMAVAQSTTMPVEIRTMPREPRNVASAGCQRMGNWPDLGVRIAFVKVVRDRPTPLEHGDTVQRGWVDLEPTEVLYGNLPDRFDVAYVCRSEVFGPWRDWIWPGQPLTVGQQLLVAILPDAINPTAESYEREAPALWPTDEIRWEHATTLRPDKKRLTSHPTSADHYPKRVREIGAVVRVFSMDAEGKAFVDVRTIAEIMSHAGRPDELGELEKLRLPQGSVASDYLKGRLQILRDKAVLK